MVLCWQYNKTSPQTVSVLFPRASHHHHLSPHPAPPPLVLPPSPAPLFTLHQVTQRPWPVLDALLVYLRALLLLAILPTGVSALVSNTTLKVDGLIDLVNVFSHCPSIQSQFSLQALHAARKFRFLTQVFVKVSPVWQN